MNKWDEMTIQQYIDDKTQESLVLEYKAADALLKTDGKKKEITKDVSAMANSAGGIIVYGIQEYQQPDKKHLPEKIGPIDQTQFTKEWLEQVINTIRPRIDGLTIHPVPIASAPSHVVYVVEISQSATAHQATDWRYYKRFNFQSVPMEDYEIRDVMNRAVVPDARVEFGLHLINVSDQEPDYRRRLRVIVKNGGIQVISRFKIILTIANLAGWCEEDISIDDMTELEHISDDGAITYTFHGQAVDRIDLEIVYQANMVLFPQEEIDIGEKIKWAFRDCPISREEPERDPYSYEPSTDDEWRRWAEKRKWLLKWTLYADNMPRKQGTIPISELPLD